MRWAAYGSRRQSIEERESVTYTGQTVHKKYDNRNEKETLNTFPSHANLKAFFEAAVLTLIAVVLIDGTIPVGAARVREVAPHAALEEALAALACKLAIVLAA